MVVWSFGAWPINQSGTEVPIFKRVLILDNQNNQKSLCVAKPLVGGSAGLQTL